MQSWPSWLITHDVFIKEPLEEAEKQVVSFTRQDHKKSDKKKDPDAPKKPLSAYFYYLQEERNTIRDKFGISSGREFNKKAAEEWKTVPKDVKEKYQMTAFEAKEKYKKDNEANKAARKAGA